MERASEITRNCISHIYKTGDTSTRPIVQICELKRISQPNSNPDAPPRYRLAISDGVHYQQAMLATQLNTLISDNVIQLNSLVRLNDFISNNLQNKRILIILNLDVIAPLPGKIGNPVGIDAAMNSSAPRPPTAGFGNENQPQNSAAGFGSGKTNWHSAPVANPYTSRPSAGGVISKMDAAPSSFFRPIQSINPYQNGWTIRGRCSYKSDLRKFQNQRGEGMVISFELTDDSGSIRVTGFTQHAPIIQDTVHLNRIYKVSRGSLKQANPKFNRSTSAFEMTLDRNALLEEIPDDGNFMQIKYNFSKIIELNDVEVKANCDVLGVVTAIGPLGEVIIRSSGEPCAKRSIHITDDSNASVELTLWRTQAENFLTEKDLERHPILLLHNATRGDFGRVCLNVHRATTLELDPVNVERATKLRSWYDNGGCDEATVQSLTSGPGGGGGKITGDRKSLSVAKTEVVDPVFSGGSGSGGAATFVTRAFVGFVSKKNDLYYPGDPDTKKKLTPNGPGSWTSESTGRQYTDEEVVWRYIMSMKVMDHSSSTWISAFDEVGQVMLGRSAKEFRDLKDRNPALADHILEDATFRPMLMKITVKERTWNDEQQIRYTAARAEPIEFASEGRLLLNEIASYGVM